MMIKKECRVDYRTDKGEFGLVYASTFGWGFVLMVRH